MTVRRLYPILLLVALAAGSSAGLAMGGEVPPRGVEKPGDCSFTAAPNSTGSQVRNEIYEQALAFAKAVPRRQTARKVVPAAKVVRRNVIDREVMQRLQAGKIPVAPLSTDEEFFRRINLDLTGRIPTAKEVRSFVADKSPRKRDAVIDRLLHSPEFVDKWTLWMGDLFQNAMKATNRDEGMSGRNAVHKYLKTSVAEGRSWREIAAYMLTATGNSYDDVSAGVNFIVRGFAPMGPYQDTFDSVTVRAATIFLGMGSYDCLMCHDGRGHLEAVSAWATRTTRLEAERMAAHFSRVNFAGYPGNDKANFYTQSHVILDKPAGTYVLDTKWGNRPNRYPIQVDGKEVKDLTPVYRDGTPAQGEWRASFANKIVEDPMFARNFANRLWKAMFTVGLAEPVDNLDPDRLDPTVKPPAGWTYQASHPQLLEELAQLARKNDFSLREMLRVIAESTTYQLSSEYGAPWDVAKARLFARHLPRRLEAEEVLDAVVKATDLLPEYLVGGWTDKVNWAMQLPEPTEPQKDGRARDFLDSFDRGNRDLIPRGTSGSVMMSLQLMNSPVIMNRVNSRSSPYLAELTKNPQNETVVEDLFLTFLSRHPTEYEKMVSLKVLSRSGTKEYPRGAAVEDLAWALINKTDFLFSY